MTCPYCPDALPDRPGAVTCGAKVCQRQHQGKLSREWYHANKAHVLAQKKQNGLCQFCSAPITSGKTCMRAACRRAYHTLWRHAKQDDAPVKFDLSAEQIERKLAALADHRRATKSGLRIPGDITYVNQAGVVCVQRGAWVHRDGCELHKRTDVTTYDLEGALS